MPGVTDYLDDTGTDTFQPTSRGGRAPKAPAVKAYDPLSSPEYKTALQARKELHDNEALYRQRLRDFDANEGSALKWKTNPGDYPGADPKAVPKLGVQTNLMESLRNDPGGASNVAANRQIQLLSERRQRIADEASRVAQARTQFDAEHFIPLRDKLIGSSINQSDSPYTNGAGTINGGNNPGWQPPTQTQDYLAPEGDSWAADRVAAVNAQRENTGQKPLAPGSVSAGNFTERWAPLRERMPQAPETDSNPVNDENTSGDETRDGLDDRVPDVLDPAARDAQHEAMANDLKAKFAQSSPWGRLKMVGSKLFGSDQSIQTPESDVSAPWGVPVGFGDAGTKGQLFTVPETQGNGVVSGLARAGNKFSAALATPENAAIMAATGGLGGLASLGAETGIGTAASALKTAGTALFAGQMAKDIPDSVKNAYQVYNDPNSTPAQKAEALATPGIQALMTGMVAKHGLEEGRQLKQSGGETINPDFNDQGGRFRPQGPQPEGGASPGTGTMLRKVLIDSGRNPADVEKLSDLEAHQEVQKLSSTPESQPAPTEQTTTGNESVSGVQAPVEPVDIGPRDTTVSDGSGTPTAKEAEMLAAWKDSIAAETAPKAEELSSETNQQPEIKENNERRIQPNPEPTDRPSELQQIGWEDPSGRIEPTGDDLRGQQLQPNRDSSGEQPRGDTRDGIALSSSDGTPPDHPDLGQRGESGELNALGIKNESVENMRKELGLQPSAPREGLPTKEAHAEALSRISTDENAGQKVVDEIADKPRQADAVESLLISQELVKARSLTKVAEGKLDAAKEAGDPNAIEAAQKESELAQQRFEKAANIADSVGTRWSDVGRMRQQMLNEDYSLAELTRKFTKNNDNVPPNETQRLELKALADKYEASQKVLTEKLAASEKARLSSETETEILRALHNSATETPKTTPMGVNRIEQFFSEQGQAARARLLARHRQGQTNALFDPARAAQDLADVSMIGAEYLAKGISKGATKLSEASAWTEQMIKDFGEEIKPHLEAIFEGAKKARGYMTKRANDPILKPLKEAKTALSDQLEKNDKATNPNAHGYLRRKIDEVNRKIVSRERALASGDLSQSGRKLTINRPAPQELEVAQQKLDGLNRQIASRKKGPAKSPQEIRLQGRKDALTRNIQKMKERLANGDFSPSQTKAQIAADAELMSQQAEHARLKAEIKRGQDKQELAKRTPLEKGIDFIPKLGRLFVLSYPSVFTKLAAAATARIGHSVAREAVISGLRQIPGVKGIAKQAPRFGSGLQIGAEVKAHTDGFVRALKASGKYLKNQEPNESVLYGGEKPDPEWTSYLGRLHGALKTPALMSEFERSLYKRNLSDTQKGLDVNDPAIKLQNSIAAYKDAKRSIFLQDNKLAGIVKSVTQYLRRPAKGADKPALPSRIAASAIDTELPITKVPANILTEVLENIHGAGTGAIRVIANNLKGVDKLTPEAADEIMRQLSNGLIGNALILSGWLAYKNIGPTHQPNEKPRVKTLKDGTAKIGDTEIDKNLLHNPWYVAAQVGATAHHLVNPMDDKPADSASLGAAKSVLGLIEETPLARESMDVSKMLENPERAIPQHVAGRLIPGAMQQIARATDENQLGDTTARKSRNFTEDLKMGVPGLRKEVPQKSYVHPAVIKELNSVGLTVPDTDKPKIGPTKRPATEDEFRSYKQASETAIGQRLAQELPRLKQMKPEQAKKVIEAITSQEHVKARVQLELNARRQPQLVH